MECLLCSMWTQTSYSKRPTTPVSAQEAEGMLLIGYWIASRQTAVPRICERHMNHLTILDKQGTKTEEIPQETLEETELAEQYQQQIVEFQKRKKLVTNIVPSYQQAEQFTLGPGPLPNENNIAPHPGLTPNSPSQPIHAQPGTIEGALEAARMPPTEGGKVVYNCPLCGEQAVTGEIHAC